MKTPRWSFTCLSLVVNLCISLPAPAFLFLAHEISICVRCVGIMLRGEAAGRGIALGIQYCNPPFTRKPTWLGDHWRP